MSLPVTVVALDLGDIFHFLLNGSGVDTHCRRVVALTLFLSTSSTPGTSLLEVLVLFWVGGGSLLSGKQLFPTRCVSRDGVGGLILSTGVFLLSLSGLLPLGIP